ncbi:MAG: DUF6198 family protein [Candidatus Bathyarchaeota archaeon]|nr:DUF6198 family protein [Candidatus Bathyarchaeota archaeon]
MDIPTTRSSVILRLPILFAGFFILGIGIVANLYATLGTSPWGVLHVGLTNVTPFTLGQITQIVGLVIVISSWLLGFSPGFGTIANMITIGFFIDVIIDWNIIPTQTQITWQITQLILSIIILGVGVFLYLRAQLGAGPRDGLMVALASRFSRPISQIRVPMDVIVVVLGFLLGGPLGVGTVISALTLGYFIQFFLKIGQFDKPSDQLNLLGLYQIIKRK